MIQAGCTGTFQWSIAHQIAAHFATITTHAPTITLRVHTGCLTSSRWNTEFMPR